jgi:hypothetical protein
MQSRYRAETVREPYRGMFHGFSRSLAAVFVWASLAPGICAAPAEKAILSFTGEHLKYTINWASGLSLGEGHLDARQTADGWQFDLLLDASVPGFAIRDSYHAKTTLQLCALEFQKEITHGKRHTQETTTFNYRKSVAKRATVNGGESESAIPACARDALSYLFYARNELAEGRVPPAQSVLAGAAYQVRLEYDGTQPVKVGDKSQEADRVTVSVKGPSSDVSFEAFFARDKARTPLLIRCPFSLGIFSLELAR